MYIEDEPYSSDDDDVGITGAIVDGNQIDEFEEKKLGGKGRRAWTTEMETVKGFNKIGEKEVSSKTLISPSPHHPHETILTHHCNPMSQPSLRLASLAAMQLFTIFKQLTLTSRKIYSIDPKTRTMFPSLTSLDVSTNKISDLSNLPSTIISFAAYNNEITDLSSFPPMHDLMQLGLGYNPIYDGLSVLPSRLPNIIR